MKRIYVAGPMSGYEQHNFPLFNHYAARLRSLGYDVVNPVDINPDPGTPWEECMKKDIVQLLTCDSVAVLPGWECSRGASLEVSIAKALGMPVVPAHIINRSTQ